jgi:hypothetical protein
MAMTESPAGKKLVTACLPFETPAPNAMYGTPGFGAQAPQGDRIFDPQDAFFDSRFSRRPKMRFGAIGAQIRVVRLDGKWRNAADGLDLRAPASGLQPLMSEGAKRPSYSRL